MRRFEHLLSLLFGLGFFTVLLFFVLKYTQLPVGNLIDWIIGFASSAWLLTIITIPWNIYFEAKTVLVDAEVSKKKNINFDTQELKYVGKVANIAFNIAISLHIISAIGLYALAYFEISAVGYYGSAASILLTFLRPATRLYQYVSERLSNIRFEVKYPRDDVYEVAAKLEVLENTVAILAEKLNEDNEKSWLCMHEKLSSYHTKELKSIQKNLQDIRELIASEDDKVLKEAQKTMMKGTEEVKFVENLVEIVRFIKRT